MSHLNLRHRYQQAFQQVLRFFQKRGPAIGLDMTHSTVEDTASTSNRFNPTSIGEKYNASVSSCHQ